jgi:hypothetical protein
MVKLVVIQLLKTCPALLNPKAHYSAQKSPPLDTTLSQINQVPYFSYCHLTFFSINLIGLMILSEEHNSPAS